MVGWPNARCQAQLPERGRRRRSATDSRHNGTSPWGCTLGSRALESGGWESAGGRSRSGREMRPQRVSPEAGSGLTEAVHRGTLDLQRQPKRGLGDNVWVEGGPILMVIPPVSGRGSARDSTRTASARWTVRLQGVLTVTGSRPMTVHECAIDTGGRCALWPSDDAQRCSGRRLRPPASCAIAAQVGRWQAGRSCLDRSDPPRRGLGAR